MSEQRFYYFDNNATTPVAESVVEAMIPYLRGGWANPSSAYRMASEVYRAVEEARAKVAALVGADPKEVVFTSCGTESNNAAWHSALMTQPRKRHILTTAVEHSANMNYGEYLQKQGYEVGYLPVESDGSLDLHRLEQAIRPDTALVSVMWANNETGVVFPLEEVAAICRSKGVMCHTDAVQTPGKLKIDAHALGVDFLSLSAHKLYAPKGIGMLYVKRRTRFQPLIVGGHQERGRRGGTENVPHIIGFGKAAELAMTTFPEEYRRVRVLRDRLEQTILKMVPHTFLNGDREHRLPNTTNLAFEFVEAEAVLMLLDQVGICASSGSACTTGSLDPSHVLTAMGLTPMRARGCVRFSLGVGTTEADVDYLLQHVPPIIQRLRDISPLNPSHPDNDAYDVDAARAKHEKDLADAMGQEERVVAA